MKNILKEIYAKNGIRTFPIATNTKVPAEGIKWKDDATTDINLINEISEIDPNFNWGAVIDEGYVVIDIDAKGDVHKHDGIATFKNLVEKYGLPPDTFTVKTPSGGLHLYFRCTNRSIPKTAANINGLMGIDIKSNGGGYVVAAGSRIDGNFYEVADDTAPIADLPEWLEKLIEKPPVKQKTKSSVSFDRLESNSASNADEKHIKAALYKLDAADFDDDYDSWLKIGMSIHSALPDSTGRELWDSWSSGGSNYDANVINTKWKSFTDDGSVTIGTLYHLSSYKPQSRRKTNSAKTVFIPKMDKNDVGLGNLILNEYGQKIRVISEINSWMIWDDNQSKWILGGDAIKTLGTWQEEIVRSLTIDTSNITADDEDKKKVADKHNAWVSSNLNMNRMNAVRSYIGEKSATSTKYLDQNLRLVGVQNGVIELNRDGSHTYRKQVPEDMITKSMFVDFDTTASCPEFENFLETVMQGDKSKIKYLQAFFGYCLTGETSEHTLNFLYGAGKNGKSVLTDTMQDLFGDYCFKISSDTLMKNKSGTKSNAAFSDLAQMQGARLVFTDEVATSASFDTQMVKSLVGEGTISAKHMYGHKFNYPSTAKLVLYGNDRPYGDFGDWGFWRRMNLIPFDYIVPTHLEDKNLKGKISKEFSGILNWCLEGYKMWTINPKGLDIPQVLKQGTTDYRREINTIAAFLDYEFSVGSIAEFDNDKAHIVLSDLMKVYKEFCDQESLIKTTDPKKFKRAVDDYFEANPKVEIGRVARGNAVFGIDFNTPSKSKVVDLAVITGRKAASG